MRLDRLIGILVGSALGLSSPVSAEPITDCGRVSAVLDRLSAQAGHALKAESPLGSQVVYLNCLTTTSSDVLASIAQLLHAEWQDRDGNRVLRRVQRSALQAQHEEVWLEVLRKRIGDTEAELLRLPPPAGRAAKIVSDYLQRLSGDLSVSPTSGILHNSANTLAKRIIIEIGGEALCRLPLGKTVVFSTKPNVRQVALPDVSKAIQEFSDTCDQQIRFMQDVTPPEQGRIWWNRELNRLLSGSAVDKVDLYAHKRANSLWVGVGVFSSNGSLISQGGLAWEYDIPSAGIELALADNTYAELEGPVLEHWTFCKGFPDSVPSLKLASAELKRKLLEPEDFDPLTFEVKAVLDRLHEVSGLDIVAVLDDRLSKIAMDIVRNGRISLTEFLRQASRIGTSIERKEQLLLIRPTDLFLSEQVRVPRAALSVLVNQAASRRGLDLFDLAAFVAECPFGVGTAEVESALVAATVVGADARVTSELRYISPRFLRLLGSLPIDQRTALRQGQAISLANLRPDQNQLLYEFTSHHPVCGERLFESIPDILLSGIRCMPYSLPPETALRATIHNDPIVEIVDDGLAQGYSVTPADLASIADLRVRNGGAASLEDALKGTFRPGQRTRYEFTIEVPPGVLFKESATSGFTFGADSGPVKFEQLPPLFRELVSAEFEKLRIGQR